jgi:AhpC/TSA family
MISPIADGRDHDDFTPLASCDNYRFAGVVQCWIIEGVMMKSLEGEKAPPFELEGGDGKKHSLEDYRGKTVVLYFYPKDNTPG